MASDEHHLARGPRQPRDRRGAGARSSGRHAVVHRALRLGQVDAGHRGRAAPGPRRAGPPTGSTATTSAPGSTATSGSAGRRGRRTAGGWRRWPACSPTPAWWPWSPSSAPTPSRGQRARELHDDAGLPFVEVYLAASADCVRRRDPKGLYAKAIGRGASVRSPGSTIPTRFPSRPTGRSTPPSVSTDAVDLVMGALRHRSHISPSAGGSASTDAEAIGSAGRGHGRLPTDVDAPATLSRSRL